MSSLIDLPTYAKIGGVSSSGIFTTLLAVVVWIGWLAARRGRRINSSDWPIVLFLAWASIALAWSRVTIEGLQNLAVYALFTGLLLFMRSRPIRDARRECAILYNQITWAGWISLLLYAVSQVWDGIVIGPRCFALFLLIVNGSHLAWWRYGNRRSFAFALLITVAIGATLSRTALFGACFMFPLSKVSVAGIRRTPGRVFLEMFKAIVWTSLVVGGLYFTLANVSVLRSRFLEGDVSMRIGSFAINASGRTAFWTTTLDSYLESPWFGKGPGSSQAVVEAKFPGNAHPHCDYLRIAHDYGVVGLAIWLAAYFGIASALIKSWRKADRAGDASAKILLFSVLVLAALGVGMLTDNCIIYGFVMGPVGAVLGIAMSIDFPRHRRNPCYGLESFSYRPAVNCAQ